MEQPDDRDPLEGLEERLQSHAKAFESLLALTPAQEYYGSHILDGKDPSEQWNRKKQTKEEKRAAKKAKLHPANQKSALDIMKEKEAEALKAKRKRDDGDEEGGSVEQDELASKRTKRQRADEDADAAEARRREKGERRKEKRQRKNEKKQEKKARKEAKKMTQQEGQSARVQPTGQIEEEEDGADESVQQGADLVPFDISGLAEPELEADIGDNASVNSSAPSTPVIESPAFDVATNHSATSSSSSIVPPSIPDTLPDKKAQQEQPSKLVVDTHAASAQTASPLFKPAPPAPPPPGTSSPKIQLPNIDHAELQERVRKRIEELRAARKADGPDGKPAKSRQELLDQRRKKEEQRKAAKKAQRLKAKEEEQRRRDEQLRGSGSPLSTDLFSPGSSQPRETNYAFSRLAFDDGTAADASLSGLQDAKKKKGPQDPRTALQAAQNKQARLAGYDEAKRTDIADKDMWLNAKKRAHGERVRDDTSLLKKALKRKEKQKSKSEREWTEREQAVVKGKEMKQKRRDANLQKRREEKGGKGKKKGSGGKPSGGSSGGKKKSRPGFEGRFKA